MKSLPGRICRILLFDTNEARAISGRRLDVTNASATREGHAPVKRRERENLPRTLPACRDAPGFDYAGGLER
jgi:hypothetical protein